VIRAGGVILFRRGGDKIINTYGPALLASRRPRLVLCVHMNMTIYSLYYMYDYNNMAYGGFPHQYSEEITARIYFRYYLYIYIQ